MTNSGIRNSTLLSQVCPVHSYNECTQLSSPQTHQGLRDRLAILQQQLDNSLSLTDDNGPTTSHSLSQLGDTLSPLTLPVRKTRSLSPVPCNLIGASLSEPHMGSKSVPRELSIYLSMYLCIYVCVRLSVNALTL